MKKVYKKHTVKTVDEMLPEAKTFAETHDSSNTSVKLAIVVTEASALMDWVHMTYVPKGCGIGETLTVDGEKATIYWHEDTKALHYV